MDFIFNLTGWLLGFLLLWRIPRLHRGKGPGYQAAAISVIIPTRNEAGVLPRLLDSLREQEPPPHEVIIVDESEDATAGIARAAGARVFTVAETPDGWMGKSWACHLGAEAATGDVLCFLDADTFFEQEGLRKLGETFAAQPGVLSVQPYHHTLHPYEQLSAFFNIVLMAGIGAFSLFARAMRPAGAFGPCLVIRRQDYLASGGHQSVRDALVEDLALGRRLLRAGTGIRLYGGKGALSFRMYAGGLGQLIGGWSKSFARGAAGTNPIILLLTIFWISAGFGITRGLLVALFSGTAASVNRALLYAGYALQVYWMLRRIGNFHPVTALLYPVPLLFFTLVFAFSAFNTFIRKSVKWKGKEIDLKGKSA